MPLVSGEGRLRARTPASCRHKTPYSSSRYCPQKALVIPTIFSCAACTAAEVVDSLPVVLVVIARPLVVDFDLARMVVPTGPKTLGVLWLAPNVTPYSTATERLIDSLGPRMAERK